LMVNFIWFADGHLLKFYYKNFSHKNRPEQSLSCICGDSLTFAADCIFQQDSLPAHKDCEMVEFLARKTLDFKPPCCSVPT